MPCDEALLWCSENGAARWVKRRVIVMTHSLEPVIKCLFAAS